jgi:hypothetical protein
MSSTDRQNNLLINQDWKKIYQSFKNADFQSYDFENLRRTMITYLRTNYPEDFNDYIESSEYLALVDLVAFVGQSVAFRVDLNARENFLELAERRDSILRLARLISYNAKRNKPAQGLLKFTTVKTTETVVDSNGRNLANQVVTWNDPANPNWYDQFIKIINAAMPSTQQFGNPSAKDTIYGIPTSQYRFNGQNTNVPIYGFSKAVAGRTMNFEITSTTFSGQSYIYEEAPKLGNNLACVYRDDGKGAGSNSNGFFLNFTQGTLTVGSFSVTHPTSNESVDINTTNINDNDVWLYRLDQNGVESELWTQVPATSGNNIIYNSLNKNIKNIYSVVSRASDAVSLAFSDGTFGNLPLGNFRTYYRVSNGLSYVINPADVRNVSIAIPYTNRKGQSESLTITMNLQTSVANSELSETNDSIKSNAPQTYYTQNRMITAEDYNISPLSVTQKVAKVKSVNRSSSGISRYFDLKDPTGKYSSTNLYANDGVLYQDFYSQITTFQYTTKSDINGVLYNIIYDLLQSIDLRNFYYNNFITFLTTSLNISWYQTSSTSSSSDGYIGNAVGATPFPVGSYTETDLKYLTPGALIKFIAPGNQWFDTNNNNTMVTATDPELGYVSYLWAEVVSVQGNGVPSTTYPGPVKFNTVVPNTAVITQIIPKFTTTLSTSVITTVIDLIFSNRSFGLRYDASTQTWQIIFETNLNQTSLFNLGKQGDTSNTKQDSSWMLLFTTDNETYTITTRLLRYIFESDKELTFYFNDNATIFDSTTNSTVRDQIKILNINHQPGISSPFTSDYSWDVTSSYSGLDGYIDNTKIVISFSDSDYNGVVDNPQLFSDIVNTVVPVDASKTYIIQQKYSISNGQEDYRYVSNSTGIVIILASESDMLTYNAYKDGQYFYFTSIGVVKQLKLSTSTLIPTLDYKVYIGRDNLKFQYTHSADFESRIDPGSSNIMDVYILTKDYDTAYRQWVDGATSIRPLPPSSDEINNLIGSSLDLIKPISDEIIYHPVTYRALFGSNANPELQATFKVTKNINSVVSDNDIQSRIITAINQFFTLDNWNFGDTFYFTELSTYVMKQLAPDITNFIIVPQQSGSYFGSLFEISCPSDQIFISTATVANITIISGITSGNIKSVTGTGLNAVSSQNITSATYGNLNG